MARKDYYQILKVNKNTTEAEDEFQEINGIYEIFSNLLKPRPVMASNSEPRYVISIAAKMVGIEPHTLRYYERLGLIQPRRSEGNIRLYSQDDVDRLCCIKRLMGDLGINLAGIEVALGLMQRMGEMQHRVEEMEAKLERFVKTNVESDIEWREE